MTTLIDSLRRLDAVRDGDRGRDVVQTLSLDAVPPTVCDPAAIPRLSAAIVSALRSMGITRLYQHQADAISAALAGNNVVLQAPTASGKTLSFHVPILQSLAKNPDARALMIYPTKALAFDQRDQLERLADHATSEPRIQSWWYDGDVKDRHRETIRKAPPPVLLTNPEMLNLSFLGHADKWSVFLRSIEWVVVDEMHEYRGYFGSNVSLLLRRFSHYLGTIGVRPKFFLCSATCANAREHAEALTGLDFIDVSAGTPMRPQRQFVFVQPDIPDFKFWKIFQLRVVNAGLACLAADKSVLVFCPSRKFAEQAHRLAMARVTELAETDDIHLDPNQIAVYRAGLTTDARQEIQEKLKRGDIRLAFTTNALELGVDIGRLDGVVLAGFPDSMMSAWQRIGRSGRSWTAESFVLYFARNNPLDRFFASNLEAFVTKPLDALVVNPENEELIRRHLPCLLHEAGDPGVLERGKAVLGSALHSAATAKLRSGAKVIRSSRFTPHPAVSMRGGRGGVFVLKHGNDEIGTMSAQQQFREAYDGAIYMHGGETYRVQEVASSASGGTIQLAKEEPTLSTRPTVITTLTEAEIFGGRQWKSTYGEIAALHGRVTVGDRLVQVVEMNDRTEEELQRWVPEFNAAQFSNAHACWIIGPVSTGSPPTSSSVSPNSRTDEALVGLATAQHLLRVGALFSIPMDSHDAFSHANPKDGSIYLVESHPGGIGVARKALEVWRQMLETGIRVAEACRCANGCPNCVVPPRSTEDLDKNAGIRVASYLLDGTGGTHSHRFDSGLWEPVG